MFERAVHAELTVPVSLAEAADWLFHVDRWMGPGRGIVAIDAPDLTMVEVGRDVNVTFGTHLLPSIRLRCRIVDRPDAWTLVWHARSLGVFGTHMLRVYDDGQGDIRLSSSEVFRGAGVWLGWPVARYLFMHVHATIIRAVADAITADNDPH